ncbi:phage holin family protein [Herbivorax sp. ANBcel31]|uniref:phage holin family protein n=1 Tax=Herbivorax sp. ANBcel31 TaxID=3069754 RepID=UPI0027B646A2|nr:phage holin family protein [Herbivorax sp. ANBcel31]MDQ2086430.1 phage holin family protein [Herbivorax sp. ANBcel31]
MANLNNARAETFNITHFIIRVVVGTVVLAITSYMTQGLTITGFWPLIIGGFVLAGIDYLATKILGVDATPFGRGITGFILAAAIIYATQYFVSGFVVSFWGAVIGALIYGIIDAVIPAKTM